MNMQGAIAALASLNHSQATAAVANAGTAQGASGLSATQGDGFGTLLQMLMGANTAAVADGSQEQTQLEAAADLATQLGELLQQLEGNPELLQLAQSGDKVGLSSLLAEQGVDLKVLETEVQDVLSLDLMAVVAELIPQTDNSQVQQLAATDLTTETELKQVSANSLLGKPLMVTDGVVKEDLGFSDLDPKLQQLIESKFAELKTASVAEGKVGPELSDGMAKSTMVTSEVGTVLKQSDTAGQKELKGNEALFLSQQGMAAKQSLDAKVANKSLFQPPEDGLAPVANDKSNMLNGLFSQGVKKSTDEIVSKLSEINGAVTSNIEIADSQGGAVASQLHFDVNSSASSPEVLGAKTQFSMVGNTVDQVQGLAKDLAMQIRAGNNEIRIAIRPEHLGEMAVKVSIEGDSVNLDLKVENAEVKQVFDASIQQLKETLTENGIKVNNLNVDIQQQDMNGQSKSRFFQNSKKNAKDNLDGFEVEGVAEAQVDPNVELQAKLYAHAAYGVNYLA